MPLSVKVPVPDSVIEPVPLMVPEILVDPVPLMVSALVFVLTAPETVNRFEELFVQVCAFRTFTPQLMARVNAVVLSIRIPKPAVPLIVLPFKVKTFAPTGNGDVLRDEASHPNSAGAGRVG